MKKLKILLCVLMAVLIAFVSQRAYHIKNTQLGSIYSDIIFTQIAVESQEYTRQIEYGLKNGKSIENFYNVDSLLTSVSRCFSYTKGVYIFSRDYRMLYSYSEGGEMPESFSVSDFSDGSIYSVRYDSGHSRYLLTLPVFGRGDEVSGYMVLDISGSALDNKLADYRSEYIIQSLVTGALCFLAGVAMMIHLCRAPKRVFGGGVVVMSASVLLHSALDAGLCVFKLSAAIDRLIQQSASKITMSLQNTLDAVSEKGVSLSKVYDLNSWLMESTSSIPFIDSLTYDRNYRISAVISDSFISERIWSFAAAVMLVPLICAACGLLLSAAAVFTERTRGTKKDENNGKGRAEAAQGQPREQCVSDTHA